MRAYRLSSTRSERPATIHDIVRRQAAADAGRAVEQARLISTARAAQPTDPWWATR